MKVCQLNIRACSLDCRSVYFHVPISRTLLEAAANRMPILFSAITPSFDSSERYELGKHTPASEKFLESIFP